ncbi:ATP-binding protein [Pseudobacteriovorax antillogorgiicola]|nr:ATP-binding protein [Pseudobacteriovorax antillogorgiicola]
MLSKDRPPSKFSEIWSTLFSRTSFQPVAKRLVFFTVGISTCFAFLISIMQILFDYQTEFQDIEESIHHLDQVSIKSLGTAIWYLDQVQIETILDGIRELPNVQQVVLSSKSLEGDVVKGELSARERIDKHFDVFYVQEGHSRKVGKISIYVSLDELYYNLLVKFGFSLLGNIVKTLSVSFLLVLYIRRTVTKRLEALGNYASNVVLDRADQESKAPHDQDHIQGYQDEISHLYEQIFRMEERLVAGYRQLREQDIEYQERLESEVKRKTEELALHQRELVEASRKAGMAEVAVGFLHNIGNIMTSIFVSCETVAKMVEESEYSKRTQAFFDLMKKKVEQLQAYLSSEEGAQANEFWRALNRYEGEQRQQLLDLMNRILVGLKDIEEIIKLQMIFANAPDIKEDCYIDAMVEKAININRLELDKAGIECECYLDFIGPLVSVPAKITQILVNLILNSIQAIKIDNKHPRITIRSEIHGDDVHIICEDNGKGIAPENLIKIFSFGFTTKKTGSGFGLHSSSLMAQELGGNIEARSEGRGKGAQFIIILPIQGRKTSQKPQLAIS